MNSLGLVLEGGGMRGVYTAGVLEYFMENDWYVPYVIGVSAGACNAASYLSRQPGRNKQVTIGFVTDKRYISYRNLMRERSIFGMNFIFNEIPQNLVPFDFETFYGRGNELVIGTTDAISGEAVFYRKNEALDMTLSLIRASSSLPFVSQPVQHDNRTLFDGGISAPIPIHQSIRDGNERNIIILTRPRGYRKKPFKQQWFAQRFYPGYPGLVRALVERSLVYNRTLEDIERMEDEGKVLVIRPSAQVKVGRMEKDSSKLEALHDLGYKDASQTAGRLREWLA
ncbi:patatin-like phospholipase family protein [Paenibacillus lutrae]|uniref:Patatin family protein n=1 Tax=Paenibacillus lutrae TaxID=2078573 RepID=A0A7X3FML1_9BACL|nr:patatin family protein [Paenibacillus lutrae]MVP02412.1 patatin family protein [Paenibacillus lutrae]